MVFSSIVFVCYFLPIVLSLYVVLPRFRNVLLLAASLFFYAWGELLFFPVLILSLVINFWVGRRLGVTTRRKRMLWVGLSANLLILGVFKYASFLDANLNALVGWRIPGAWRLSRIPLGISFFTFQSMSYLIDVYRRDTPSERRFTTVALYITMFPQLVAGPIVRFKDICREIHHRSLDVDRFAAGLRVFVYGLAFKVLLANTLAVPADAAFNSPAEMLGVGLAWLGLFCYALQIYFDFAGYSLMAIGMGRMLGFKFPRNFNLPYVSGSITEFWRRWHMSLSTWFRDYLYIPLGGSRRGALRTYVNLTIVFLLCGLWHGASWTFVLWGAYHGAFLVIERITVWDSRRIATPLRRLYALAVVFGGWVLFRCNDLAHVGRYLRAMAGVGHGRYQRTAIEFLSPKAVLVLAAALIMSGMLRSRAPARRPEEARGGGQFLCWGRSVAVILLMALCLADLATNTHNPFIYFNF